MASHRLGDDCGPPRCRFLSWFLYIGARRREWRTAKSLGFDLPRPWHHLGHTARRASTAAASHAHAHRLDEFDARANLQRQNRPWRIGSVELRSLPWARWHKSIRTLPDASGNGGLRDLQAA